MSRPGRRSFWLQPMLGTIGTVLVVGGVASAIALGPWLQERGYPGFAIVVLVWLVAMVVVVRVVCTVGPPRTRMRKRALRVHVPRVARSLYPPAPPPRGSLGSWG